MTDPVPAYRVLARKYRPATFAEVIGQEAMVRTLTNAIAMGRIAHAFILTGVRGVGKTTTARILARALNCIGADGSGGPTTAPCGVCEHCRAIAEDRHIDVIEMDAASRTGVDDIRELIDGMRYHPVSARYKVYIIDEVHMLSKNAFNALLKTLEEPPPDVKFIFATTEINKVPVTVLSRCQRFSLRRVPADLLVAHYRGIAASEAVGIDASALGLIARAADGSVRDGLSLLDQAIALSGTQVTEAIVRDMLGIADRGLVFDLFETVLKGDAAGALDRMDALYQGGADPLTVMQDLLELSHVLTRLKLVSSAGGDDPPADTPLADADRPRARALANALGMPTLVRTWQILLKGLGEVQLAPDPVQAAAMVLVRLAYVADLPSPAELIDVLSRGGAATGTTPALPSRGIATPRPAEPPASSAPIASGSTPGDAMPRGAAPRAALPGSAMGLRHDGGTARAIAAPSAATEPHAEPHAEPPPASAFEAMPQSFAEVAALFERRREGVLRSQLLSHVHLVAFEPGKIEFRPAAGAPANLANRLSQLLSEWTGTRWVVAVSAAIGQPTLRETEEQQDRQRRSEVAAHPLVRAVLEVFPGATIAAVREREAAMAPDSDAEAGDDGVSLDDAGGDDRPNSEEDGS